MRRRGLLLVGIALLVSAGFAAADSEWEEIDRDDGIVCWRKDVADSPIVAFRGEGVIEAPIARVARVLEDTSRKTEWVAKCLEAKDVKLLSPLERIEYNRTSAPWPISDRDFVFRAKCEIDPARKTVVYSLRSLDDPACPANEDLAVRGELLQSKYTLTALSHARTRLVVEIQADPKGSIPKWVVNFFQRAWPHQTIEGIRAQVAKSDVCASTVVTAAFEGSGEDVAAVTTVTR
jgi:hypothetical protein